MLVVEIFVIVLLAIVGFKHLGDWMKAVRERKQRLLKWKEKGLIEAGIAIALQDKVRIDSTVVTYYDVLPQETLKLLKQESDRLYIENNN